MSSRSISFYLAAALRLGSSHDQCCKNLCATSFRSGWNLAASSLGGGKGGGGGGCYNIKWAPGSACAALRGGGVCCHSCRRWPLLRRRHYEIAVALLLLLLLVCDLRMPCHALVCILPSSAATADRVLSGMN